MTLGWSNSFMQAASRRKSSISVRVQMATRNKQKKKTAHRVSEFTLTIINTTDFSVSGGLLNSYKSWAIWGITFLQLKNYFLATGVIFDLWQPWCQGAFAVYSLFIVLTATLRTDSSCVNNPSITEPNSPDEETRFKRNIGDFHISQWHVKV